MFFVRSIPEQSEDFYSVQAQWSTLCPKPIHTVLNNFSMAITLWKRDTT